MPDEIYVLWWDNGESYEDAYRSLVGLFEDEDNVCETIKGRGYTLKEKNKFYKPNSKKHICSIGKFDSLESCRKALKHDTDLLPCDYCQGEWDAWSEDMDYSYMFYEKLPLYRKKGV